MVFRKLADTENRKSSTALINFICALTKTNGFLILLANPLKQYRIPVATWFDFLTALSLVRQSFGPFINLSLISVCIFPLFIYIYIYINFFFFVRVRCVLKCLNASAENAGWSRYDGTILQQSSLRPKKSRGWPPFYWGWTEWVTEWMKEWRQRLGRCLTCNGNLFSFSLTLVFGIWTCTRRTGPRVEVDPFSVVAEKCPNIAIFLCKHNWII